MVENINGASENNNQARQYPLNEQNIAAIANIMKLFKNGKGNDAQRAFQSLIETNLSGANSEATENDTHTLSGISKSLSQNCKHYIESLRGAKVVIDGDTYEFDVRTGGMSISNHDKDKHMQFSYDHQENVAIFDTED